MHFSFKFTNNKSDRYCTVCNKLNAKWGNVAEFVYMAQWKALTWTNVIKGYNLRNFIVLNKQLNL